MALLVLHPDREMLRILVEFGVDAIFTCSDPPQGAGAAAREAGGSLLSPGPHGARGRARSPGRRDPGTASGARPAVRMEDVVSFRIPPFDQVGRTVEELECWCRFQEPSAIVVQTEYAVLPGSLLCRRLGRIGIPPPAAFACTNRLWTRSLLERAGIPGPRWIVAETAGQAARFGRQVGFPLVLKGLASTMARNVIRVDGMGEIEERVAELKRRIATSPDVRRCVEFAGLAGLDMGADATRQFLVEEYVEGRTLEIDGFAYGRRLEAIGVLEQDVSDDFFIDGYLFPAEGVDPGVVSTVLAALRAVGMQDGGFSVEARVRDGIVHVIEINARLGEDAGFPDLFRAVRGRYPILDWIDYLQGREPPPARAQGTAALAYVNHRGEALVRSCPAPPEDVSVLVLPGDRLLAHPHPDATPHVALALRTHPESSRKAYHAARSALANLQFDFG